MRKGPLFRGVMTVHRYLGVLVGTLMTVWCLSGFVMMYQGYPRLAESERLAGLQALELENCCVAPALTDDGSPEVERSARGERLSGFVIEMLDGRPVLRASMGRGAAGEVYDLTTGAPFGKVTSGTVQRVAERQAAALGVSAAVASVGTIGQDQWTVQFARRHQPLYQVKFEDPGRSHIYVSGVNGQAFQHTNSRERLLGWMGAVPHFLYPTLLRQNGALWTQVVIWSSIMGIFLTITGVYVGIVHLGRRKNGRWSPFRGLWYWHHMIGLAFGVLTLTWVFSGLMTMNPWGLLSGRGDPQVREILTGRPDGAQQHQILARAMRLSPGPDVVQLTTAQIAGHVWLIEVRRDGSTARLDEAGRPTPTSDTEVRAMLAPLKPVSVELMTREDAYYYGRGDMPATLPVYRAILPDAQRTRIYLDADTGQVRRVVDRDARLSRWLRNGLHSLDFAGLRNRPLWDLIVLPLLLGVTAVCATGAWMSFRRVGRDFGTLGHVLRRRR